MDRQILIREVWDPDVKIVADLKGHKNAITDLRWSENSERIYSCSADNQVIVWDCIEGKVSHKLKGHKGIVNAIDYREGLVVTASDDGQVLLWDEREKDPAQSLELDYPVTSVALSQTHVLYGGVDNAIKAWNLTTQDDKEFTLFGHTDTISGI